METLMETTMERAYYAALFRRDYGEAQRLYRDLARTQHWTADQVVREGHECGLYDAADRREEAGTAGAIGTAPRPRAPAAA